MAVQERFTLRNLYLYLVCLITLVIAIFSTVSLVRNVVELAYPRPDDGFEYAGPAPLAPGERGSSETDAHRELRLKANRESQRRESVLGLVGSGTTLLIVAPLYAYHWRKVQGEVRASKTPPAGAAPAGGDAPTT